MKRDDMVIVSVDDHVLEPPGLFDGHVPERHRDRAPRVVSNPEGSDAWLFEGKVLPIGHVAPTFGFLDGAVLDTDDRGDTTTTFDQVRRGCWNVHDRVRDMDLNGQLGSMNFPQFARFAGQIFTEAADKTLSLAMLRAYNDWHVEDWAGAYPDRLIPLAVLPMWDANLMADEVKRMASKGCHAVTFSVNPFRLGLPSIHSTAWDPFWAACSDTETVVCLHLGSDSVPPVTSPDAPRNVSASLAPLSTLYGATDILWSDVFRRFPVKIALAEGGIGWIPWILERIDYSYRYHSWTGQDFGDRLPSEVFREHVICCFIDDPHGVRCRHEIGIETICIETDFPHSDSTWPNSPESIDAQMVGVPDDEVDLMTHLNAMRHFHFDPFAHRPRSACTVGALRRSAGSDQRPGSVSATMLLAQDRVHHA